MPRVNSRRQSPVKPISLIMVHQGGSFGNKNKNVPIPGDTFFIGVPEGSNQNILFVLRETTSGKEGLTTYSFIGKVLDVRTDAFRYPVDLSVPVGNPKIDLSPKRQDNFYGPLLWGTPSPLVTRVRLSSLDALEIINASDREIALADFWEELHRFA